MWRLLIALLLIGSAADSESSQATSLAPLAGRWKSTATPVKGEAPAVEPDILVETKGGTVMVTMGLQGSPMAATAFDGGRFLLLKRETAGKAAITIIIRPADAGRVRVEYFFEYPGRGSQNFYYSEIFARAK